MKRLIVFHYCVRSADSPKGLFSSGGKGLMDSLAGQRFPAALYLLQLLRNRRPFTSRHVFSVSNYSYNFHFDPTESTH